MEASNAAPAVTEVVADIPAVIKETKTGYKTTEFWVTLVTAVLALVTALPIQDKAIAGALAAAYALARGFAKQGVPAVEPEA